MAEEKSGAGLITSTLVFGSSHLPLSSHMEAVYAISIP